MTNHLTEPGGKVRLYVEAALAEGARVEPGEGQAHYLLHVMRAKAGERVSLFNGRDGEWLARIDAVSKRGCVLICERQTEQQSDVPDLWLVFAPIKKTPADYLTQKAAELGVRLLQPVFTRRTIITRVNTERMRANATEAAEQSGRLSIPEIREAMPLEKLLASWPRERRILFCDESGDAPPIAEALKLPPPLAGRGRQGNVQQHIPRPSGEVRSTSGEVWAILTGPEGGFDPAERERIRALPNAVPVTLGRRILRADTAALAALAVWQAVRGDWR